MEARRLRIAPLYLVQAAKVAERPALTSQITALAVQGECLLIAVCCLLVIPLSMMSQAKTGQCARLAGGSLAP